MTLWDQYAQLVNVQMIAHFGLHVLPRRPTDPIFLIMVAVFGTLPQLLMASCGGFLGLSLAWSRRCRLVVLAALVGVAVLTVSLFAWLAA